MGKSKNVGQPLTKHMNLASGEKVVKFHMEGNKVVVDSIDGEEKPNLKKLFPTEAERAEYDAELDIIAREEGNGEEESEPNVAPGPVSGEGSTTTVENLGTQGTMGEENKVVRPSETASVTDTQHKAEEKELGKSNKKTSGL